jgi:NAD-dependent DNA ligase
VEIEKAGEVIPAVLRSFPEERVPGAPEFDLPALVGHKCPVCGGRIAKLEVADEEAQGCGLEVSELRLHRAAGGTARLLLQPAGARD